MKKNLIKEISRQLQLMSIDSRQVLLTEDGILKKIVDAISSKIQKGVDRPVQGANKISPGKTLEGGVNLKTQEIEDLSSILSDWTNLKQYLTVDENLSRLLRTIIMDDEKLKQEIFADQIDDLTREIGNRFGKQFTSDLELYDFLKTKFNNIDDIKNLILNSNPNPGDDFLMDIVYEVMAEKVYMNTKSARGGQKLESTFNEITNDIYSMQYWNQLSSFDELPKSDWEKITSYITPSIRQSISQFFEKFNQKEEFQSLQKVLKRIEGETDLEKKRKLKKYVVQKYAWINRNQREVWKDLDEWISDVAKQSPDLETTLSVIKKAITDKNHSVIKSLAESDGTLRKIQRTALDVWSLSQGSSNLQFGQLVLYPFRKVRQLRTKDEQLKKTITDKLKENLSNTKAIIKSGSKNGWWWSEKWAEITEGNIPLARKKMLIEYYSRAVRLHVTYGVLWSIFSAAQSLVTSSTDKKGILACKKFLEDNAKKMQDGTLTDENIATSPCTLDRLMAIRNQDKGGVEVFIDNMMPDIELSIKGLGDVASFLFPGFYDDLFMMAVDIYLKSFDIETPEQSKKLMEEYYKELNKAIEEGKSREERANNSTTQPQQSQDEKYANNLEGFKQFLKDNPELPAKDPQPNKNGGFSTGSFTFTWIDTNKDKRGRFELKKQDF